MDDRKIEDIDKITPSQFEQGPPLVYALGTLDYDFGTGARHDSFDQAMDGNPNDPRALLNHLDKNEYEAAAITWTLNIDATPIYAVRPGCPYANIVYQRLREFLKDQLEEGAERISVPGFIMGQVSLMSGQTVPVIIPELRGMYCWTTDLLVSEVAGKPEDYPTLEDYEKIKAHIYNFLERVYHELRNLGRSSHERAINYAATNAFEVEQIFENAIKESMELDSISVEPSPICRPGSDCRDVKLTFFHPENRQAQARKVYSYAIDVSNTIPVTVGHVRSWPVY
ncbi:MAG: peptidase [Desulfobacterales bacterium]|nr:peptidase [Desulfobacterales bacterium]